MKIKILWVFLIVGLPYLSAGQEYKLVGEIPLNGGKFTTDPLGNIYEYTSGDVTKYSPEGHELNRFSTREFGSISFIDASNPLKTLVVYSEFSKAIILDASLGRNTVFDLTSSDMPFVKLICSSKESGFWIFDPVAKRLKKFTDQLEVSVEGTQVRQITEEPLEPIQIIDSGNWLIMNSPDFGLLIYDRFGTYYKTIKSVVNVPIQANGDEILYKDKDLLTKINIKTGASTHFTLPANDPQDECRVAGSRIFIKKKDVLEIYTY